MTLTGIRRSRPRNPISCSVAAARLPNAPGPRSPVKLVFTGLVNQPDQSLRGMRAARLARGAADWLINGPAADPEDPSLYHGLAGVVLALHEAQQHFGDDRYRQ